MDVRDTLTDLVGRWEIESEYARSVPTEDAVNDILRIVSSWDGLMCLLDQHWPEGIFPTYPDRDDRDPGPRIVSLIRWVDRLKQAA